jgi:four helix bundle protein
MKHNFRELKVWKDSIVVAKEVYLQSRQFPEYEKYGLTSQVNRAVVSIASNIAEGSARSTNKDFCNFLGFSLGSAYEVETQLILAREFGYLSEDSLNSLLEKLHDLEKKISNLQNRLRD